MKKINIGIAGLGIIGASLLKCLSKKNYNIFCTTNSSLKKAKKYTPDCSNSLEIMKNCKIIFVCSKIDKTIEVLEELNKFLNKNQTVVEVTSIKKEVLKKNNYNFNFILSHPMSGTTGFGFDKSKSNLFLGNKWLLDKKCENKTLEKIIKDTGSSIVKIDMKNHDKLCAQISHIEAVISSLIFLNSDIEARAIASSGFRDFTRLALTESHLLNSMFFDNQENIEKEFKKLTKTFDDLKKMSNNERIKLFSECALIRDKMYDKNGKNIFKI